MWPETFILHPAAVTVLGLPVQPCGEPAQERLSVGPCVTSHIADINILTGILREQGLVFGS